MTFTTAATSGWINNKRVMYTYGHTNTLHAFAIIEDLSGWKRIAPVSADGVTNVLEVLKAAKGSGRRVNVYLDETGQIHAAIML